MKSMYSNTMKRITCATVIATSFLLIFPNVSYAGMTAAGASCSKAGATSVSNSKKFTCIKVGKKLVWDKGVAVAKPAANPTPSESASPTPSASPVAKKKSYLTPLAPSGANPITWQNIESRYADVSAAAWQSTQDTLKANATNGANSGIKVIWAPNTATSHYAGFEDYLRTGVQLWSRFTLPPQSTFLVYSYDEIPWASRTMKKILTDSGMKADQAAAISDNLSHAPYGGPDCGGANAGMISDVQAIGVFGLCARNEGTDPYYKGPLQIHEFTHQLQGAQYIGSKIDSQSILPCWISEGLAHTAGLSAGTTSLDSYLEVRKLQASNPVLNIAGGHSSTPLDRASIDYKFLKSFYAESAPPGCFISPSYSLGYSVGFLTTEALSSIGGIESTLLLYKRTADGETFEDAFKNVYGISWSEASDTLAKVVSKEFQLFK